MRIVPIPPKRRAQPEVRAWLAKAIKSLTMTLTVALVIRPLWFSAMAATI